MLNFLIRTWRSEGASATARWETRALFCAGAAIVSAVAEVSLLLVLGAPDLPGWCGNLVGTIHTATKFGTLAAMVSAFVCFLAGAREARRARIRHTNSLLMVAAAAMDDDELDDAIAALRHRARELLVEGRTAEAAPVMQDQFVLLSVRRSRVARHAADDS